MLSFPFLSYKYSKTTIIGILILIVCLFPSSGFPHLNLRFSYGDKIVHFLMFFTFSAALSWDITYHKKNPNWPKVFIIVSSVTITFGIITELLQYFITALKRNGDINDLFYDLLGTFIGIILVIIIRKKSFSAP